MTLSTQPNTTLNIYVELSQSIYGQKPLKLDELIVPRVTHRSRRDQSMEIDDRKPIDQSILIS